MQRAITYKSSAKRALLKTKALLALLFFYKTVPLPTTIYSFPLISHYFCETGLGIVSQKFCAIVPKTNEIQKEY